MSEKFDVEEILIVDEKRVEQAVFEEDAQVVAARASNGYGGDAIIAAQAGMLVKDTVTEERVVEEVILAAPRRRRKKRWLFIPLLLALLLALLLIGTAFASSTATITLTLEQHTVAATVAVYQNAHTISTTGNLSGTVPASTVYVPGQYAQGLLTFHSANLKCGCATVVPAGTVFRGADGVAVMTESAAILGPSCTVTVPAQALMSGPVGDIRANDVNTLYSKGISVHNGAAFHGGTNGYWYAVVQQQSIDALAQKLSAQLKKNVPAALTTKGSQGGLILLSQQCTSSRGANHKAGERVKSVTVTVSMTCAGQAYDPKAALAQALQMLTSQAQAAFGNDYTLTNLAQDKVITAIVLDPHTGIILVTATVQGQWTYQLQQTQKQEIAYMLAGKDTDDAIAFLREQRGIHSFSVSSTNFTHLLPIIADNIKVVAH